MVLQTFFCELFALLLLIFICIFIMKIRPYIAHLVDFGMRQFEFIFLLYYERHLQSSTDNAPSNSTQVFRRHFPKPGRPETMIRCELFFSSIKVSHPSFDLYHSHPLLHISHTRRFVDYIPNTRLKISVKGPLFISFPLHFI